MVLNELPLIIRRYMVAWRQFLDCSWERARLDAMVADRNALKRRG